MDDAGPRDAFESVGISSRTIETVAWLTAIAAIALAGADVAVGQWDHDSGMFLLRGGYVAEGLRPYIDYSSIYPPVNELITGFFVRLGIQRLLLAVGLPILWILANMAAAALLTWSCTRNRGYSVLVGTMFSLIAVQNGGNHVTLEHPVSFFALLSLAAVVGRDPLTPFRLALAGLAAAACGLSKQNGAVVLLPLALILWQRRTDLTRRHVLAFIGGLAILPLALLAWLGFDLPLVVRNVVGDLHTYAGATPRRDPAWVHEFTRAPASSWFFTGCAAAAVAIAVTSRRARWIAAAALAGGALEFGARLMRNYPHYNLAIWPFAVLILAIAGSELAPRWRAAVAAALLVFAPVTYLLLWMRIWPAPSPLFTEFVQAAEIISTHTPPDGVVRQYGSEPILEFLADRREDEIDKGTRLLADWRELAYTTAPDPATTVVLVEEHQPWMPAVRASLAATGWQPVGSVGDITVLRKKP